MLASISTLFSGASKIAKAMKPSFEEIKFSRQFEGDYNLIENDAVKIYSPDFDFENKKKYCVAIQASLTFYIGKASNVMWLLLQDERPATSLQQNFHYKTDYCKGENCFKFSRGD